MTMSARMTTPSSQGAPLGGRKIVVTRPEPGELDQLLTRAGASVVSAPTIGFVDPDDGGAGLTAAVDRVGAGAYDWVVFTSSTAVDVIVERSDAAQVLRDTRIAAIGPGTARRLAERGIPVEFVPPRAVGESLADTFPSGDARVLVVRPEVARDVVPNGLRTRGFTVDEVAAYRTVTRQLEPAIVELITLADAVTFTSPSTVGGLLSQVDRTLLPPVVVSIGPVTSRALRGLGIAAPTEADPHTVEGLVAAVVNGVNAVGSDPDHR